jgi:type IV pilus assembly protein PilY1
MKCKLTNIRESLAIVLLALGAMASAAVNAQDVELFTGTNPAAATKPNVLIIIDNTSNWGQNLGGLPAWNPELLALSNTVQGLLANGYGDKVRVGMMMFVPGGVGLPSTYGSGNGDGGYVRFAVRDMNATNAAQLSKLALGIRDRMINVSNAQSIEGANNAGYSQSMAEAYYYYFQKAIRVGFGDSKRDCGTLNTNNVYTGSTAASSYNLISPALTPYAYSGCGSGDITKPNDFNSAASNAPVNYVPPPEVSNMCQRNYIIFISNGPIDSSDNSPGFTLLQNAVAAESAASSYTQVIPVVPNGETAANFADEWAKFLNEVKNVSTFTINTNETSSNKGLAHQAMMQSMATNGGGDFCKATDPASIQACINEAFNKILSVNSVFASVSLPVSSFPQLQNLDQVYMGMFRPDSEGNPRWFGNLKQFKLAIDSNNNPTLVDALGSPAIDPNTGQVFAGKTTYWTTDSTYWAFSPRGAPPTASDAPDGPLVEKGGAAERLRVVYAASGTTSGIANRKVFTCVGCSAQTSLTGGSDSTAGTTSFSSANASTFSSALRAADTAAATALIKWVRGENVDMEKTDGATVEARPSIHGDVLHSRPSILTLSPTNVYVFYGANDGMIHAIRGARGTDGGNEVWSFLPEEFFPRLSRIRTNTPITWSFNTITTSVALTSGSTTATVGTTTGLLQGMYLEGTTSIPLYTSIQSIDAATNTVTLSKAATGGFSGTARFVPEAKPAFADGTLSIYDDPNSPNKRYMFASMRRGGRFVYAFDITDPDNPIYLWRKGCNHALITSNNGYGCDSGYDELGQTWSEPRVARIGSQASNKTVMIFGAGYDPTVEDPDPALTSGRSMGRGVFVVDIYTGAVLQHIRPPNMDFSVPSDITLIDFDGDGFLDRLYFGDTGGQVWRVDTAGDNPGNWMPQRIASLGLGADSGLSGSSNGRKFLFPPDVVETAPGSGIYAILLVSGDRENPLNGATDRSSAPTVVNRIYMLLDGPSRGTTVLTESDLANRTSNASAPVNLGWYISLSTSGEKGTGSVVTLSGTSYAGTNYPVVSGSLSCFSTVGNARFYTLDFLTGAGRPPNGSTPSNDITQGRFTETVGGGMPPSPVGTIIQTSDNKFMEAVLMGTKSLPVGPAKVGDRFRNFWYKIFDKK